MLLGLPLVFVFPDLNEIFGVPQEQNEQLSSFCENEENTVKKILPES